MGPAYPRAGIHALAFDANPPGRKRRPAHDLLAEWLARRKLTVAARPSRSRVEEPDGEPVEGVGMLELSPVAALPQDVQPRVGD